MLKKAVLLVAVATALASGQAVAEIGTIDDVPAATLLLPYFEVDLNSANGVTTLFSINNASASAAVAHVTVWTDLSVPVLDFDVYLTGYDVQTINMRDILNGILPRTADFDSDPDADTGCWASTRWRFSCGSFFPTALSAMEIGGCDFLFASPSR